MVRAKPIAFKNRSRLSWNEANKSSFEEGCTEKGIYWVVGEKNANGGKNTYSDVAYIISKYSKCGCGAYVTRKILEYQCRLYKKGLGLQKESNNVVT